MNEKSKVTMDARSKSTKEIYNERYPRVGFFDNPLKAIEAIGWLRCTEEYIPSLTDWIEQEISFLLTLLELITNR